METNKLPMVTIDLKKYRIRIMRNTLNALGRPEYIQILINPSAKEIVIHKSLVEDYLAHKVTYKKVKNKSYELYSRNLIQSIQDVCPVLIEERSYVIPGKVIQDGNLVKFSLDDAEMIYRKDELNND